MGRQLKEVVCITVFAIEEVSTGESSEIHASGAQWRVTCVR